VVEHRCGVRRKRCRRVSPVSRDRLVVVDADLPRRLASGFRERKREAVSAAELGIDGFKDPELLRDLAARYNGKREWVLLTGDDAMPAEHGSVIIEARATVATIHPEYPEEILEHHWRVDVAQRWIHAMQQQQLETVRRYSIDGSQPWKPRRRHIRQIAIHGWKPWRAEDARVAQDHREQEQAGVPPATGPGQERLPGLDATD
jgi:hypothetical protein